jgi:hypothetical protein
MYVAQDLSVKLDLLGVQTINLVSAVAKSAGIDLNKINLDDYETIYQYLQCLEHPYGLFQISGHTAIRANNKIKPKNIDEVAALLAIARPGAMAFTDQYADYLNNGTVPECPAEFREILEKTGGVCIFQETLMSLFCRLGFSLIDANTIRDIVGKKKRDKIAEWEPKIFEMARKNGISEEAAKYVWDVANASADYSFNRCAKKDCEVETTSGTKKLYEVAIGDFVKCFDIATQSDKFFPIKNVWTNRKRMFEVETEDGYKIQTSIDHKYLCEDMQMRSLKDIMKSKHRICVRL